MFSKKQNKVPCGFTLIELIVVIAIIGVISIIVVPLASKNFQKGKDSYNENLKNELIQITKNYLSSNPYEYPKGQVIESEGNDGRLLYKVFWMSKLQEKGYIKNKIKDSDGEDCEEKSYVTVENINGNYKYEACLICNNNLISGDKNFCKFTDVSDNNAPKNCKIIKNYDDNNFYNSDITFAVSAEDFESGISFYKINDNWILSEKSIEYTVKENKNYKVYVYDKAGNRTDCGEVFVNNIDKIPPTCKMKVTDKNYLSNTVLITTNDDFSGILSVTMDNYDVEENKKIVIDKNGTFVATVKDKASNIGMCKVTTSGIDDIPPQITAVITKNIKTDDKSSYGKGSIVTIKCIDNESGIGNFEVENGLLKIDNEKQKTQEVTLNTVGQNITIKATCKDFKGNVSSESFKYNVKEYTQSNRCGYDDCLTGSNTCRYGCNPNKYWCDYSYSGTCKCTVYTTGRQEAISCNSYAYSNGCNARCKNAGYYSGTGSCNRTCSNKHYTECSDCYYGSNTCKGGYKTCWHY